MRVLIKMMMLICFFLLVLISYWGLNYYFGNFHTVIPGEIYRSRQLDGKELEKFTTRYHIKTIINLRGVYPKAHWYQVESQFAASHHLNYYAPWFKSNRLPPKSQLRYLVFLLETAPKPLLFHCQGGADRTGMAAAISVILFKPNASIAEIKRQDSWIYNVTSAQSVGHLVLPNYFHYLKKNHLRSSKQAFLVWLLLNVSMQPYQGRFLWVF